MQHAVSIPLSQLIIDQKIHDLFPRHSPDSYADLKESITRCGMLTPLCVGIRGNHYVILDGETRYQIAQELQYEHIACDICEDALEEVEGTFLNIHRRQLDPSDYQAIKQQERIWSKEHLNALDPSIVSILSTFEAQRFLPTNYFWKLRTYSPSKQRQFAKDLEQTLKDYSNTIKGSQPLTAHDASIAQERNALSKKCSMFQETIRTLEEHISSLQRTLQHEQESHDLTKAFTPNHPLTPTTLQVQTILDTSLQSMIAQVTTVDTLIQQAQCEDLTIGPSTWENIAALRLLIETITTYQPPPATVKGTRPLTLVSKND